MIHYITKALQENDSVYVNDLGTFTKHYVSARIDGNTLHAPHYEVTLDTNIDHEEIVFTNLVCRERQCLLTQANSEILQWVDELKQALNNNKSVTFEDFGTFSLIKGDIHFDSELIDGLNIEFEGMEDLSLVPGATIPVEEGPEVEVEPEPITEPKPVVIPEPTIEPEPVIEPEPIVIPEPTVELEPITESEPIVEPEPVEKPEPIVEPEPVEEPEPIIQYSHIAEEEPKTEPVVEPEPVIEPEPIVEPEPVIEPDPVIEPEPVDNGNGSSDDDGVPVKRKRRIWPWILVLLLLAIAGVLIYLLRGQLKDLINKLQNKKEPVIEQIVESEPEEATPVIQEDTIVEEETPVIYTPDTLKMSADQKYPYIHFEEGHFYVIAGSFPSEKDAERHIRQTGLDKYSPSLVLQDGVSNIRICIGIFPTEEEGLAYIDSINKRYWVLK
ncbi:MAG: hypothetical protein K6A41_10280 [Bacteroidales bacterium]|nr:hypothetical protein [Bacteroidales bacterium]